MNRIFRLLPILLLSLQSCGLQSQEDVKACTNTSVSPDQRITTCTKLIDSKQLSSQDLATVFNSRGIAWADKRDYVKAVADYNEALRINPLFAIAYYHRFVAQQSTGRITSARTARDKVAPIKPKITPDAKQAAVPNANPMVAPDTTPAADAKPSAVPGPTPTDAAGFNRRGNAWADKRDYDRAIADYSEALRINPQYGVAYYNRGLAWRNKRDYDRAIADYSEAVRINPKNADAYNNRGIVWSDKRDYDRAIADYNETLRINPRDAKAFNNRGYAWNNKRDYDRAIADYSEALTINPQYALAYYNRGNAWRSKRDPDRAIADYSEALRINPQYALAYYHRGNAKIDKRDYERGVADYNEALRLNPRHVGVHNSAAWILATAPQASVRNGTRAVELARKAADLSNSKDADILDTLAAAYAEAKNFPEAVRWQEKALEFPDFAKDQGNAAQRRLALYRKGQPYHQSGNP